MNKILVLQNNGYFVLFDSFENERVVAFLEKLKRKGYDKNVEIHFINEDNILSTGQANHRSFNEGICILYSDGKYKILPDTFISAQEAKVWCRIIDKRCLDVPSNIWQFNISPKTEAYCISNNRNVIIQERLVKSNLIEYACCDAETGELYYIPSSCLEPITNKKDEYEDGFPLFALIYKQDNYEFNYVYTAEELQMRDEELYDKCISSSNSWDWHKNKSILRDYNGENTALYGTIITNKKELYDFYSGNHNDFNCSYENRLDDIYAYTYERKIAKKLYEEYLNRFEKYNMICLSTNHITEETCKWLEENHKYPIVYQKGDYGFFIHIPDSSIMNTWNDVPKDLMALLRFAKSEDFHWIMLDSDGPVLRYENLKIYEW